MESLTNKKWSLGVKICVILSIREKCLKVVSNDSKT